MKHTLLVLEAALAIDMFGEDEPEAASRRTSQDAELPSSTLKPDQPRRSPLMGFFLRAERRGHVRTPGTQPPRLLRAAQPPCRLGSAAESGLRRRLNRPSRACRGHRPQACPSARCR